MDAIFWRHCARVKILHLLPGAVILFPRMPARDACAPINPGDIYTSLPTLIADMHLRAKPALPLPPHDMYSVSQTTPPDNAKHQEVSIPRRVTSFTTMVPANERRSTSRRPRGLQVFCKLWQSTPGVRKTAWPFCHARQAANCVLHSHEVDPNCS